MGLRALGVEKGDRVAILSENRPEWAFADLAALAAAAVDVPIYATLTPSQVLYILNDSEAKVCFVSNLTQAKKIAEVKGQAPVLKHVIRMEDGPGSPRAALSFDEVRAQGAGGARQGARRGPATRRRGQARRIWPPSSTPRAPPATPRG